MGSTNGQTLINTAIVCSTLSLCLPVNAANVGFEQVVIFGNSVSDTGNVFNLTGGAFPPSPLYYEGRFSDSLVWTDYLSQDLDLDLINFYSNDAKNKDSSINFAIGGATSGTTSLGGPGLPGVATQVDDFIDFLDGTEVAEDALVILWSGENDYVEALNQGTILNPQVSIARISNSLTELANSGAKHILVPNLPYFGHMPIGQVLGNPEQGNMLTAAHNSLLTSELDSLSTLFPETNFVLFDANSVIKEIVDNPTDFGFNENHLETCLSPDNFPNIDPNVVRCDNPNEFIYFDNQHFTSSVHRLISDAALETIEQGIDVPNPSNPQFVPEPRNTFALIALGVSLLFELSRKKKLIFEIATRSKNPF